MIRVLGCGGQFEQGKSPCDRGNKVQEIGCFCIFLLVVHRVGENFIGVTCEVEAESVMATFFGIGNVSSHSNTFHFSGHPRLLFTARVDALILFQERRIHREQQ